MSTSASITNTTVRTRSLPERPKCSRRRRGCASSAAAGSWLVVMALAPACASSEAAQEVNDAPQRSARQIWAEVADGATLSDFAPCRVGSNHLGKRAEVQLLLGGPTTRRD